MYIRLQFCPITVCTDGHKLTRSLILVGGLLWRLQRMHASLQTWTLPKVHPVDYLTRLWSWHRIMYSALYVVCVPLPVAEKERSKNVTQPRTMFFQKQLCLDLSSTNSLGSWPTMRLKHLEVYHKPAGPQFPKCIGVWDSCGCLEMSW